MNTLEFENGVTNLDLNTLSNTVRYEMANGKLPKSRPVEHFQLIQELGEEAARAGLNPELETIFAAQRQAKRINWTNPDEPCPVQNFLIERLATRINLPMVNDNGRNMAIAVGFHEKGITLGFGSNVHVCSNMQVFGENVLRTYGRGKVDFDTMQKQFNAWMAQFHEKREQQERIIDDLNTIDIDHEEIDSITGDLFKRAVLSNAGEAIEAPLNQLQVSELVKSRGNEIYAHGGSSTAYDVVQWGTHALKPQRSDMVTLIDHNNAFCDYVRTRYSV